ncbi:unnamed protein product, partial [marine sediment metagenome]
RPEFALVLNEFDFKFCCNVKVIIDINGIENIK